MTIKALIFDVGGVLLRTEDLGPRQKWAQRFSLDPSELADAVFESPASVAASEGKAGEPDVWAGVQARFGLTAEETAEFRRDFFAGDRFDEALLDWIAARRGRYHTGILSNAWNNARGFLTGQPKLVAAFDLLVISAEEGVSKPEPAIYERALQRLGVSAPEAVFVDDNLKNIEAARRLGLAAVRFQPEIDLPAEMARLGVD